MEFITIIIFLIAVLAMSTTSAHPQQGIADSLMAIDDIKYDDIRDDSGIKPTMVIILKVKPYKINFKWRLNVITDLSDEFLG